MLNLSSMPFADNLFDYNTNSVFGVCTSPPDILINYFDLHPVKETEDAYTTSNTPDHHSKRIIQSLLQNTAPLKTVDAPKHSIRGQTKPREKRRISNPLYKYKGKRSKKNCRKETAEACDSSAHPRFAQRFLKFMLSPGSLPRPIVVTSRDVELGQESQKLKRFISNQRPLVSASTGIIVKLHDFRSLGHIMLRKFKRQPKKRVASLCTGSFSLLNPPMASFLQLHDVPLQVPQSSPMKRPLSHVLSTAKIEEAPPIDDNPESALPTNRCTKKMSSQFKRANASYFSTRRDPAIDLYDMTGTWIWDHSTMFVIAAAAGVTGTSNVSRFPYFLYFYNGFPFVIAYLIIGSLMVVPLLSLQIGLAQMTRGGCFSSLECLSSRARGLALCFFILGFIGAGAQAFDVDDLALYLSRSFSSQFEWRPTAEHLATCQSQPFDACDQAGSLCAFNALKKSCAINTLSYAMDFYKNISSAETNVASSVCIISLVWTLVIVALARGFSALHTVATWTISATLVLFLFLTLYGITLDGSTYALKSLFSSGTLTDFKDPYLWSFAIIHGLSSVCIATPLMFGLASKNPPRLSPIRSSYLIFYLDFAVSCLAGVAIFPFLGFLRSQSYSFEILEVTKSPSYILWAVMPIALSYLPGAQVFSFLFFLTSIITCTNSSYAQLASLHVDLSGLRILKKKFSPTFLIFLLGGSSYLISLTHNLGAFKKVWDVVDFTRFHIAAPATMLMFSILAGWLDGWKEQSTQTGSCATAILGGSFFMLLLFCLLASFVIFIRKSLGSFTVVLLLMITYLASFSLLSLVMAYLWRLHNKNNTQNKKRRFARLKEAAWWLFIGNVELLRIDLNGITIGKPPATPSVEHKEDRSVSAIEAELCEKENYGHGRMCFGNPYFSIQWSLCIKYIIPLLSTFALCFQAGHIHGKSPVDPRFGTIVFGELVENDNFRRQLLISYTTTLICLLGCVAFFAICAGFSRPCMPLPRVTHSRNWLGHYDLPLKRRLKNYLKFADEIKQCHWEREPKQWNSRQRYVEYFTAAAKNSTTTLMSQHPSDVLINSDDSHNECGGLHINSSSFDVTIGSKKSPTSKKNLVRALLRSTNKLQYKGENIFHEELTQFITIESSDMRGEIKTSSGDLNVDSNVSTTTTRTTLASWQ